jgi:hypothetical protein
LSFGAAQNLLVRIATETLLGLRDGTRVALSFMANSFALMLPTVERLLAKLLTRMFGALANVAGCALGLFAAVAWHRHIDIARWTSSWVAKYLAVAMLAVLVFPLIAIFTTTMR